MVGEEKWFLLQLRSHNLYLHLQFQIRILNAILLKIAHCTASPLGLANNKQDEYKSFNLRFYGQYNNLLEPVCIQR